MGEVDSLRFRKLELGCGQRPTEGYLHQDVTKQPEVELDFVCNPWEIPIPANSLTEIIALGCIEHLRYREVRETFAHMVKILQPGGEFNFDVPDMKVWSEYLFNLTHGLSSKNPFSDEHVWSTIYGWQRWPGDEHKSGWTRENLLSLVKEVGFSKVEEGVQVFTSKGFSRNRFSRPHDAHLYVRAIK